LHHHDVDLLDVLQDEVHQILSLAEAEVPAAQCSVGVVIVVWEPVPRRELEYPGDVGVAGEGVIWECEDLVLAPG